MTAGSFLPTRVPVRCLSCCTDARFPPAVLDECRRHHQTNRYLTAYQQVRLVLSRRSTPPFNHRTFPQSSGPALVHLQPKKK